MKIKNIEIKNNLILAPMAGVTEFAFRGLAREFGAGLSCTEMVNAKGLIMASKKDVYKQMLYTLENENPSVVQIFGNEPEIMAKACTLPEIQKFDIIDINFGCPAPKIVKNKQGSALLLYLDLAEKIACACVKATNKPITAKFRIGYESEDNVAVEFAKRMERAGIAAITIHGRTRAQFYSGTVDYETIKNVKDAVKIPVIGNGDVRDLQSYQKMLDTGVDAVMVGRGALGKPWLFSQLLNQTIPFSKKEVIKKHFSLLSKVYDEKFIVNHMRKHLLWYVNGEKNANKLRLRLCKIQSIQEAFTILDEIFE